MLWLVTEERGAATACIKMGWPVSSRVGVSSGANNRGGRPAVVDDAVYCAIVAECDHEFRLKSEDGDIVYAGVCKEIDAQPEFLRREPLDWGELDARCTVMEYRRIGKLDWKTIEWGDDE